MSYANMHFSVFFFYCILLVVCLNHPSDARDTITRGNPIRDDANETLISAGEIFELGFFTPEGSSNNKGNRYVGIWYHKLNQIRVVWVANRDNPVSDSSGSFEISEDGNLKVVSNGDAHNVTRFKNAGTYNRTVKLLDSGNLIVFESSSRKYLWQSFEHPTDTFLPGMKMDDNMVLTSWSTATDPATGGFRFGADQGIYQIFNGSILYWTSGEPRIPFYPNKMPYDIAYLLSGFAKGLDESKYQTSSAQNKSRRISYNFTTAFDYNLTEIFMNSTGEVQYYKWDNGTERSLIWSEPGDRCSVSDTCGKFSTCASRKDPEPCSCFLGFQAVNQEAWQGGDHSGGCKRTHPISCDKKEEIIFLRWPLTNFRGSFQPFHKAKNRDECEVECMNICNCEAYYSLEANSTERESGNASALCWIGTGDLTNLQQEYDEGEFHLYLRFNVTDIGAESNYCDPCGNKIIPYPLSTGPHCGDPLYNGFYCENSTGSFQFQMLNGSTYQVIRIYKEKRSFVIEVSTEIASNCDPSNLSSHIVSLSQSSPFFVDNWCYNSDPGNYLAEPSNTPRHIEISWRPPFEPSCSGYIDCLHWPNSSCRDGANGPGRCYCNKEYQWNGTNLNCTRAGRSGKSSRRQNDAIIAVAVVAAVLFVCFFSYSFYHRQRMTKRTEGGESSMEDPVLWSHERSDLQLSDMMDEDSKSGTGVPFYSWESMLAATDNFSDAFKLGRGGFGLVYKGMFPGGREMAVKRLSSSSVQGINEFRNEVMLIAKLQHRNLVRLLGYCIKENEKILLYEYMPNKSLDAFIFDEELGMLLNWKKRFDIILGIARGVLYLHQDSRLRIIHRDLKTSNILLDEEMNPKISDFGLARIVEGKGTEASTKKVVGTYGYMSPEYASHGLFSIKSDVYSFGVVVLEIISGKKNTGFFQFLDSLNLLGYVWRLWTEKRTLDLVDPILKLESCEKSEVIKCINVGLLCVQEDPDDRPTMSNVVFMLGGEATSVPVPNQPAFLIRKRTLSTSSSSSAKPDSVFNELTMSAPEGR